MEPLLVLVIVRVMQYSYNLSRDNVNRSLTALSIVAE
jgi:hypothetical protein